jgi:ElaB/YqjD/DUF883 family membrane-anchored ribosome-binding protein
MPKELYEKSIKDLQAQLNQLLTSSSSTSKEKEAESATINKTIQALKNEQQKMEQINKNVLRFLENEKKKWFRTLLSSTDRYTNCVCLILRREVRSEK